MYSGTRTDVDEVVGCNHHITVVFNDDDAVAEVAQLLQTFDKALVVALVKPDRGFVEDIEYVDQLRTNLCCQADTLRFAARE